MAARFSQMPTLGEFIERAKHYGYALRRTPGVVGRRGEVRIRYLKRGDVLVDWPDLRDADRLTRITVERLCRNAQMPLDDFGLTES